MGMTYERTASYQGLVYRTLKRQALPKVERDDFDQQQERQKRGRAAEPSDFSRFDDYRGLVDRKRALDDEGPERLLRRGMRRKLKDLVRDKIQVTVLFAHVPVIPLDKLLLLRNELVVSEQEFVKLAGASARLRDEQVLLDEKEREKERETRNSRQLEQSEESYKLASKYDQKSQEKPKPPFSSGGGGSSKPAAGGGSKK